MKNFKRLKIWQMGMEILEDTYKLSKNLPDSEKFGLIGQMNRAAVSIPPNISEGSSRKSEKEYGRFLEIALGSAFELETQVLAVEMLQFTSTEKTQSLLSLIDQEQKMIMAFLSKLGS